MLKEFERGMLPHRTFLLGYKIASLIFAHRIGIYTTKSSNRCV